nr:Putative glycoprotein [Vinca ringspot virus]
MNLKETSIMELIQFLTVLNATITVLDQHLGASFFSYDINAGCAVNVQDDYSCPLNDKCGNLHRVFRVSKHILTRDFRACIAVNVKHSVDLYMIKPMGKQRFVGTNDNFPNQVGTRKIFAGYLNHTLFENLCKSQSITGECLCKRMDLAKFSGIMTSSFREQEETLNLVRNVSSLFTHICESSGAFFGYAMLESGIEEELKHIVDFNITHGLKYNYSFPLSAVHDFYEHNEVINGKTEEFVIHPFYNIYFKGIGKVRVCPRNSVYNFERQGTCTNGPYLYPVFNSSDFHIIHNLLLSYARNRKNTFEFEIRNRSDDTSLYYDYFGLVLEPGRDVSNLVIYKTGTEHRYSATSKFCMEILFNIGDTLSNFIFRGITCSEDGCRYAGVDIGRVRQLCNSKVFVKPKEFTVSVLYPLHGVKRSKYLGTIPYSLSSKNRLTMLDVYEYKNFYVFNFKGEGKIHTSKIKLIEPELEWYNAALMFFAENVIGVALGTIAKIFLSILSSIFGFLFEFGGCCFREMFFCIMDSLVILILIFPCYSHLLFFLVFVMNMYVKLLIFSNCCFSFQQNIIEQFNDDGIEL